MTSTFFGLEMMKKALFAQQTALNTVGHNISNANTPGYSRQRVNMSASQPMYYPSMTSSGQVGQLGTGVDVQSVTRLRESFLDAQYRNQNQLLGEWEVKSDTVQKLEAIFNEPSDTGLTSTLNQFFNAWQSLSTDPNNPTARAVVLQRAQQLTDLLHQTAKQLSDLDSDITANIQTTVKQFNSYITQIQKINGQIQTAEVMGANANDLRDQRDYLVDQLSKMADIQVVDDGTSYQIQLQDGTGAWQNVLTGTSIDATLEYDSANKTFQLNTNSGTNSVSINSGQLKGMADSRTNYVGVYQNQLDAFTKTLVETINIQHKQGHALANVFDASSNTSSNTNIDFFDPSSTTAAMIKLYSTDSNLIAASASDTYTNDSGLPSGDGDNALAIAKLMNQQVTFTDSSGTSVTMTGTFEEYIRALVGQLGVQGQEADQMQKNQSALVDQMDNMRQSVSGVSLDEEMADMIKYQQAYSAAARMVTTIDSLLNTIINGLGLTR